MQETVSLRGPRLFGFSVSSILSFTENFGADAH